MSLLEGLRDSPAFLVSATVILGLIVGSFLNVVIVRLPRMMEREWKRECRSLLELPAEAEPERFSLVWPGSQCPACGAPIRPWHNVPLLGWLWLRGRCASCQAPISAQYPIVEFLSGVLSGLCAWRFGWSAELVAALVLTWALLALTVIDLHTQLLPDDITLPLVWLGLLLGLFGLFTPLKSSVIGAMAGYLSLWSVYQAFRLTTGKEGMGFGDFKLLAALGAWLGWQALPLIILLSSAAGALAGIGLIVFKRVDRSTPIPFGPYLAAGGWIALMWGDRIGALYLGTGVPG